MRVNLFYRNVELGFSIERVFHTIQSELIKTCDIEEVYLPRKGSMPWDTVANLIFAFRKRGRVNHVTGHVHDILLAFIGRYSVLTIHDLVFIDNSPNFFVRFYKWLFWVYIPVKSATRVVCISHETKRNLLKYVSSSSSAKVSVISNPVDPSFKFVPKTVEVLRPVILHIGTGWNKNLKRTILALEGISCHLRIIGRLSSEMSNLLLEKGISFSNVFDLPDERIVEEYVNCDFVNFPSIYEGFGMPIIEGQKTGRVVVTSRIEPLIEVSGNAVEFVDPLSIQSIRDAYVRLVSDRARIEMIVQNGLLNSHRFTVDNVALQYLDIYKEISEN